jgi:hypothetical protein
MSDRERTDARLKHSAGLIHDNLNAKWKTLLLDSLGIKKEVVGAVFEDLVTGAGEDEMVMNKKVKVVEKKKKAKSVGMRKLEKASTKGMKSIGSFFTKK